jgi:hypothetical protein
VKLVMRARRIADDSHLPSNSLDAVRAASRASQATAASAAAADAGHDTRVSESAAAGDLGSAVHPRGVTATVTVVPGTSDARPRSAAAAATRVIIVAPATAPAPAARPRASDPGGPVVRAVAGSKEAPTGS